MPDVAKSTLLLFVYGTLMKGFREDWQRKVGAEFVGQGSIRASLYDLGDYPGARQAGAEPRERVSGELYRLRDSTVALKILDRYEEFFPLEPRKSLFIRKRVSVILDDENRKRAWAYLYNRAVAKAESIPSGRYRDSDAARQSLLVLGSHAR
jgi:pyruvate carboxylase